MQLPYAVRAVMERLTSAGFTCHIVGGCVRDSLLGLTPHDWDLTTNALPEQTAALFTDRTVIPTGMKHGTVTVLEGGMPLEITTYRTDGVYHDHRRPDSVAFVTDIVEDLRRRDFTVNAMAWNSQDGLCDPFGGQADLNDRVLRCVGKARERFDEDALRILRALRFAATYGFSIENETADALFYQAPLLAQVAAERVRAELDRLLTGEFVGDVLRKFHGVLYPILPELRAMAGFEQHSHYHDKDVLMHTIAAVEAASQNVAVRLALLLHDSGKPQRFTRDEDGTGHFYGHASVSERIAADVTRRLRYDRRTQETVSLLVKYHDTPIADTDAAVRRWLNRLGEERLRLLWEVQEGDSRAHAEWVVPSRVKALNALRERMDRIVAEGQCVSLKTLAVGGDDLGEAGIPSGKMMGECLRYLLNEVLSGNLPNERGILLAKGLDYFAKNRYNKLM
ncbi:MAG: HD domain-containing protein [Clostridia bacterium]|nr:HD domain-containing protein [Clostridia bacterium]